MQQENTTQRSIDKQNTPALPNAEFEDIDPDENERQWAAEEMTEHNAAANLDDDLSDEHPPEQHVHFPISFADWGPRNSLL
jgi:hypothetical protein